MKTLHLGHHEDTIISLIALYTVCNVAHLYMYMYMYVPLGSCIVSDWIKDDILVSCSGILIPIPRHFLKAFNNAIMCIGKKGAGSGD